jgi:hypothetical protein
MAFACVDLNSDADLDEFLDALRQAMTTTGADKRTLGVNVVSHGGLRRLFLLADYGNIWLEPVLAKAATETHAVMRVVLGLDHDEYGIEHLVLSGNAGELCRVQHVYVYPDGEPDDDYGITVTEIPACSGVDVADDGTVDGPRSWAAVAALYDVPTDRVAAAAAQQRTAHDELGVVFTPFQPWWDAIDAAYLGGEPPDVVLRGGPQT